MDMKSEKKVSRPAVVYFRLSAKEQRISHFHLEAQEAAVQAFCKAKWLSNTLLVSGRRFR